MSFSWRSTWIALRRPNSSMLDLRSLSEDRDEFLVVASLPGGSWMTRDVPGRTRMPVEERIALYLKEELGGEWYERVNTAATLTIHPPEVSHCIRLFWDADWNLRFWYVNLKDPYKRTQSGIQVNDHTLDIVVAPDLTLLVEGRTGISRAG